MGSCTTEKATVSHFQQANETYREARRILEDTPTMYKALNHQLIGTIKDTYITELRNKYTRFMGSKIIYLVHHLMERYGNITETELKENHKIFDEALETTILIDRYFERI